MSHFEYCKYNFVGKINGLSEVSKKTSKRLLKRKGLDPLKNRNLRWHKQLLSDDIRHHLLAYAFLFGKSYKSLESKCADNNKPSAEHILNIIQLHVSSYDLKKINIEIVKKWLGEI